MKFYTAHIPARYLLVEDGSRLETNSLSMILNSPEAARSVILVKVGFSWASFLIPPVWLIYHRMWSILLIFLGFSSLLGLGMSFFGESYAIFNSIAPMIALALFSFEANDLWRINLMKEGYRPLGIFAGRNMSEAATNLFEYAEINKNEASQNEASQNEGSHDKIGDLPVDRKFTDASVPAALAKDPPSVTDATVLAS